jgi:hypothetical protein
MIQAQMTPPQEKGRQLIPMATRNVPSSSSPEMLPKVPPKQQQQQPAYEKFLDDAREALVGIPADIARQNGTMYEILTRNDRLRGLGTFLVIAGVVLALSVK